MKFLPLSFILPYIGNPSIQMQETEHKEVKVLRAPGGWSLCVVQFSAFRFCLSLHLQLTPMKTKFILGTLRKSSLFLPLPLFPLFDLTTFSLDQNLPLQCAFFVPEGTLILRSNVDPFLDFKAWGFFTNFNLCWIYAEEWHKNMQRVLNKRALLTALL